MRSRAPLPVLQRNSFPRSDERQELVEHIVGVDRQSSSTQGLGANLLANDYGSKIKSQLTDP